MKVNKVAGDNEMRYYSAIARVNEFKKLGYPRHMLKAACTYIAATPNILSRTCTEPDDLTLNFNLH